MATPVEIPFSKAQASVLDLVAKPETTPRANLVVVASTVTVVAMVAISLLPVAVGRFLAVVEVLVDTPEMVAGVVATMARHLTQPQVLAVLEVVVKVYKTVPVVEGVVLALSVKDQAVPLAATQSQTQVPEVRVEEVGQVVMMDRLHLRHHNLGRAGHLTGAVHPPAVVDHQVKALREL